MLHVIGLEKNNFLIPNDWEGSDKATKLDPYPCNPPRQNKHSAGFVRKPLVRQQDQLRPQKCRTGGFAGSHNLVHCSRVKFQISIR